MPRPRQSPAPAAKSPASRSGAAPTGRRAAQIQVVSEDARVRAAPKVAPCPAVHFRLFEGSVQVLVNQQVFDEGESIGKLDIFGLLRKVGCLVSKETIERQRRVRKSL